MDDRVEIKDISAAMHQALIDHLGQPPWRRKFHIITHSTGALVTKDWVVNHYVGKYAKDRAFGNLVFLAGPHFGSRLAHHGRSMLAQVMKGGETGEQVLTALELGSQFSWDNNLAWLDQSNWKAKGIRPYCLIGDRVDKSLVEEILFASKILPAAYETGSDEVVRVAAANLNFRRYCLDSSRPKPALVGAISDVAFAALPRYTHSGDKHGIMNSITRRAKPEQLKYQNLRLIIDCLKVSSRSGYDTIRARFQDLTKTGRLKKRKFAQLDFSFRDHTGAPINDYAFTLGATRNGKKLPSQTVIHTHKNQERPNNFTAFLDLKEFEPDLTYFMKFDSDSGTGLFGYDPDPYLCEFKGAELTNVIAADHCSQIEVILGRRPSDRLFRFHTGAELERHHVRWDRDGRITDDDLDIK